MHFFRDFSIRAKLIFLATMSGGVALLLCCTGFVVNDVSTIRAAKIKELLGHADALAFNSTAVLTFQDATAGKQLLTSLHLQPSVELGCLYNSQGQVLATYIKDGGANNADRVPPVAIKADGHRFTENGHIELSQQIMDKGEFVGSLYLLANMDELNSQLWDYAKITAVVIFCSLGLSLLLSIMLQRTISHPIMALSNASKRITSEGDYSIRVEAKSKDELGDLCLAFNRMLAHIEATEDALHEANDRLEDRVTQRTAQLEEEIIQRKSIQVSLEHSRDAAEAANRAKSEFLANMSHEIRTPMNAILGFTELLVKGGDEAERQEHLDIIRTSGQHLLGLINDILDLSKVEAGKLEVENIRCSPAETIAEVVSVLRVRAGEKGLTLDSEWPNGVPETIETDPARLRQLLMNLVGNAIKFTQSGGVHVRVRLMPMEAKPLLAIEVVDTGIGIPHDKLGHIFKPFAQADNSVTRKFGGTGLGLAICRRITESLGGTLEVSSEIGKGSIFTAIIGTGPLEGVEIMDAPPADGLKGTLPEHEESGGTLPPARILLVEDGDTNRKLIGLFLGRAGATVSMAENGRIGVDMATRQQFDLILMDMQMPVMDGYTATRLLREQGITIPIIALTAHAMKGDAKECIDAGCSGYLTKPISSDTLVSTIGKLLKKGCQEPDAGTDRRALHTESS